MSPTDRLDAANTSYLGNPTPIFLGLPARIAGEQGERICPRKIFYDESFTSPDGSNVIMNEPINNKNHLW
jgi:hypothetical protein